MFKTTQKNLKFFLGLCLFLGSIGLFLTNCNIGGGSSDQTTGVDKIAPVVISTLPADQETGVALNTEVSASFSEVMDANTINANSFSLTLQQNGNVVPGSVSYNGSKAVLKPLTNLNYNTEYTAIITTMAKDLAGNPLFTNHSWSFKTLSDTAAPQINSFYPVENAQGVAINASISVTFDEAMDSASITDTVFLLFHGTQVVSGQEVSGTIIYSGNTAVFKPSVLLNISTIYTAIISTGAKDLAGNALSQGRTWSFTTSSSSDITPPSITTTAPSNNAIGVALSSVITATFNENMNGTTINVSSFTVNDGTGNIAGAVSYDGTTDIATFTPSGTLDYHKLYTVTINSGAQDMAGNSLSLHTWSFTTEAAPFIDLIVDSISLSSHNVMQGGTLDVTLQISNTGTSSAGFFGYNIYLSTDSIITSSDTYVIYGYVSSLSQGSNTGNLIKTITIPGVGTGDYYVGAFVDPWDNILESNKSNNTNYDNTKITITENPNKPDLIVDSVSLSSYNVMQGGTMDVTLQISNTGIWPASSIWYELRLSTDGTIDFYDNYLTSGNIANLAQGSNSGTLIKTITIPSIGTGDYYIGVIVDPNSNILETNESNNTKYDNTKITITENPNKPDLVVDSISLSSYNIIQGGTLDVTLQISNIGNLNSNSNYFTIYMSADGIIDISDTYVADGSFSNLSPGSSTGSIVQTITIPGNPGTGDFYIGVIVDPWNDIAESNETNNSNLDGSNLTINFNPNLWKIATFACNPDNNINTIVALYASDGMTLIWYDWDTSDGPYGKIFYGLSSGTYYVVVYNTFNPGIGCYYLKVTQGAIPTSGVSTKSDDTGDIFPDQSSADMAGAIILNTDTIHYDNDTTGGEDWFKIVIP